MRTFRGAGACTALLLAAVGLAGCGDDGDGTTTTAPEATIAPGPANTAEVPDDDRPAN